MRSHPVPAPRLARLVAVLLTCFAILGASGGARAALERPAYSAGDRWRYVLAGSLNAVPGLEAGNGTFDLRLGGRVEVEVLGAADANIRGTVVPAVRVVTRTFALLSGSFTIPGFPGSVSIEGTLFANSTELWETEGYIAVETTGRSVLGATIATIVTLRVTFETDLNATTSVVQGVSFPIDVGESAGASLDTNLTVRSTVTGFGPPVTGENTTSFRTEWNRTVVSQETITVEAGTFSAYRLNQTLAPGLLPGLGAAGSTAGGNETAFFSNEVGYYVKRVVYANGTPISEMQLRSYVYAARAPPFPFLTVALIAVAAAVVVVPFAWLLYRRKKRPTTSPESPPRTDGGHGPE